MTLAQQLRTILENVLPPKPDDAVLGTALLELVRPHVQGTYSDHTIRQTFSHLSADATSPIARIEQGFGYYRRQPVAAVIDEFAAPNVTAPPSIEAAGRDFQAEEKFRAFFIRNSQYESRFPVHVEHTAGTHQPAGVNKWKFPDVVELEWDAGETGEDGFVLDKATLEVKRSLGEQPFRLTSIELKPELALGTFRENFFQCVSNSMWAHAAKLVIAAPVSDALLAKELRRLGTSYGVQIQTFNMPLEKLEELPRASAILKLSDDDFEKIRGEFVPTPIAAASPRSALDWDHIQDMKNQSAEFEDILDWIARCLSDSRAYTFERFKALRDIESGPG